MNMKNLLTAALLLFVGATLVFVVIDVIREQSVAAVAPEAASSSGPQVIVYYLHSKTRCATCNSIEAQARETVETRFADELTQGQITWKELNFEAPENEPLAKQFELFTSMVVLVDGQSSPASRWKALEDVWVHVYNKPAFQQYVQTELRRFLEETR